jgi:hypothetical protein
MSSYLRDTTLVSAAVGGIIGQTRNNVGLGALLGFLLGPLGWLVVIFADKRPQCPQCLGRVPVGARKCQHCASEIAQWIATVCPACSEPGKVA